MNTLQKILIGAVAMSAIATGANAAGSADVAVNAKIINPVSITGTAPLNFGTIVAGTAGTVIVAAADGARSGTATIIPGSTTQAASFTVTGEANTPFNITFSNTGFPTGVTLGSMTTSGCGDVVSGAAIASGTSCTLKVGGTLSVTTAAAAGLVAGTLTTTVLYQ